MADRERAAVNALMEQALVRARLQRLEQALQVLQALEQVPPEALRRALGLPTPAELEAAQARALELLALARARGR